MLGEGDVRLRREFVLKRGAAPHAGYFSLLAQRKVTKRKGTRLPLDSCAPRFRREAIEGSSMTLDRRAESILRPLRVIPAESSGARRGKREKNTHLCSLKQLYPHSTGGNGDRLIAACFGVEHYSVKRIAVCFPYGDPEHRSLEPGARSAGSRAPFGRLFFWILFFGRAKKSISPAGRDPHSN